MIQIEVVVEISQSPSVVFDYVIDLGRSVEWQSGMKESYLLSEEPMNVGSRYVQEASFLGQRLKTTFEITNFQPGREISASSIEGPFPLKVTRIVEPWPGGSRFTTRVESDPGRYFKVAGFILKKMVESTIKKDCANLQKSLSP